MSWVQIHVLLLTLAYVTTAALLLAILSKLAFNRLAKVAAILAASSFYVAVFFSTQGLLGWSAPRALPERFKVLWTYVVEPDPAHANPGAVHLWVEELDAANLPSGEPRSYLLPYSRQLADRVNQAQTQIKDGMLVGGKPRYYGNPSSTEGVSGPINANAPPGGDPSGGGVLDPAFLGGQSKNVDLIPLPKPILPEKELTEPAQ
ncbi:hypothetical protein [Labrys neptuniae]